MHTAHRGSRPPSDSRSYEHIYIYYNILLYGLWFLGGFYCEGRKAFTLYMTCVLCVCVRDVCERACVCGEGRVLVYIYIYIYNMQSSCPYKHNIHGQMYIDRYPYNVLCLIVCVWELVIDIQYIYIYIIYLHTLFVLSCVCVCIITHSSLYMWNIITLYI